MTEAVAASVRRRDVIEQRLEECVRCGEVTLIQERIVGMQWRIVMRVSRDDHESDCHNLRRRH